MPPPPGSSSARRDLPVDFADNFVRMGWEEIEEHYAAGQGTIKRWMRQVGELELIAWRRGYKRKLAAAAGRPNAGGRKPGSKAEGLLEANAGDPALAFMPIRRMRRAYRAKIGMPVFPMPAVIGNGARPRTVPVSEIFSFGAGS